MQTMSVAEAKARFSALLSAVEAGEEIVITRRGKAVARLMPAPAGDAAALFRAIGGDEMFDVSAPPDRQPEPAPQLD